MKTVHKNRINILYVEESRGFGGSVTCLCSILKRLDKNSFNPLVLVTHIDLRTQARIEQQEVEARYVKCYHLSDFECQAKHHSVIDRLVFSVSVFIKTLYRLLRVVGIIGSLYPWLRKRNIDMVHLNNKVTANTVGLLIAKLLGVPCVCHNRGYEYRSFLTRFLVRIIDFHIPMSIGLSRELTSLGVIAKKQSIVYPLIDVNDCVNRSKRNNSSQRQMLTDVNNRIAHIGMLQARKGQKVFIWASSRVFKFFPSSKFYIIGDIPAKSDKAYKVELMELISKLGLSNQVIFTGYQVNIFALISSMDIVVFSSILPEAFGMVIIEAMALGKPIIASRVGGPEEIIDNGKNGFLTEPGNSDELCEVIFKLLRNPQLAMEIGRNGRETITERFSGDNDIKQIEAIYNEVLSNHSRNRYRY